MDINAFLAATPSDLLAHDAPASTRSRTETQPEALEWCLATFNGGSFPSEHGRNTWLAKLTYYCNERGVPLEELESHAISSYAATDFDAREITNTIRGIYARASAVFDSKPYTPTSG